MAADHYRNAQAVLCSVLTGPLALSRRSVAAGNTPRGSELNGAAKPAFGDTADNLQRWLVLGRP